MNEPDNKTNNLSRFTLTIGEWYTFLKDFGALWAKNEDFVFRNSKFLRNEKHRITINKN